MSIEAITLAFREGKMPSTTKFLLVALANFANAEWEAYPSIETLVRYTSMNRKTVISGLDKLEDMGLLVDTGRRVGPTQSVKVYFLQGLLESDDLRVYWGVPPVLKSTAVPFFPEAVPKTDGSSPVLGRKQSLKRDSEPSVEPSVEPKEEPCEIPLILNTPDFKAIWEEYAQHRKQLRKPLTTVAAKRCLMQLEQWGLQRAIAAIKTSITHGWTGVFEPKAGNGSLPTWKLINQLEESIKKHKANPSYVGYVGRGRVTPELAQDFNNLRKRLDAVTMGNMQHG